MKKGKLTYIANLRLPTEKAHSIQIMKMCEAFTVAGADVELVIPNKRNNMGDVELFEYYGVKTPFKIRKIPSLDLLGKTRCLGRIFYWLDLATFLVGLHLFLRLEKGSTVYSRDPLFLSLFGRKKYTLLAEIHSLPARRRFFLKILNNVQGIIVTTKHLKEILIASGFTGKKIMVASDAVDLDLFNSVTMSKEELREKFSLPLSDKLIGYVGALKTMGMGKGVDMALKALKSLERNEVLVLVGGHPDDVRDYKIMAKELGILDRVIFVGRVVPAEVPLYLKAFDLLIAPFPDNQHYRYYMSPLKLFEYMASGVPMILSDLPSIREIVDESSATLFEPGNLKELAVCIKYSLDNPEESQKKVERSLALVQKYTWIRRAENILEFLPV